MTLIANVQLRIPTGVLTKLTNANDRTATTPNLITLGLACDDVEADFQVETGSAYDDTEPMHVSRSVEGVRLKLRSWINTGLGVVDNSYDKWMDRLNKIEDRTAKAAFSAKTNSNLSPTRETGLVRPINDKSHMNAMRTNPPNSRAQDPYRGR